MKKYTFNKKYLEDSIKNGIILLEDNTLSKKERTLISEDIDKLEMFLKNNFTTGLAYDNKFIKSIDELKNEILIRMKKIYDLLGSNLINYILDLEKEQIFKSSLIIDDCYLSIEEQEEFTIKNYEKHSKYFLEFAKDVFSTKPSPKIQVIDELDCSSFCYFSHMLKHPFIVVDPEEDPFILNHEVQHGIEYLNNYTITHSFSELGPIFFELLFLDTLYENGISLLGNAYQSRISDANFYLKTLSEYFKIIINFSNKNFEVSNDYFINTLLEIKKLKKDNIIKYLNELITENYIEECICYLLSYLKAIELRYEAQSYSGDCSQILIPYIEKNNFNFYLTDDSLKIYEKFVKETHQKTKNIQY